MKNRKQQTLSEKRARRQPTKRSATRSRALAPRGKAGSRAKAAPDTRPASLAPEDGALALGAQCTVAEAESLKSELARRLQEPGPVALDVSALQRIDTAGLQLLAAFVRDRRTAGRKFEWRGRASALEAAAGLLGLSDMLELAGEVGR